MIGENERERQDETTNTENNNIEEQCNYQIIGLLTQIVEKMDILNKKLTDIHEELKNQTTVVLEDDVIFHNEYEGSDDLSNS